MAYHHLETTIPAEALDPEQDAAFDGICQHLVNRCHRLSEAFSQGVLRSSTVSASAMMAASNPTPISACRWLLADYFFIAADLVGA